MFPATTLEAFLARPANGRISVLFLREEGCRHCEAAAAEIAAHGGRAALPEVDFFALDVLAEPSAPLALGLVGVPAFLRIDPAGRRRLRTGFGDFAGWKAFVETGANPA